MSVVVAQTSRPHNHRFNNNFFMTDWLIGHKNSTNSAYVSDLQQINVNTLSYQFSYPLFCLVVLAEDAFNYT